MGRGDIVGPPRWGREDTRMGQEDTGMGWRATKMGWGHQDGAGGTVGRHWDGVQGHRGDTEMGWGTLRWGKGHQDEGQGAQGHRDGTGGDTKMVQGGTGMGQEGHRDTKMGWGTLGWGGTLCRWLCPGQAPRPPRDAHLGFRLLDLPLQLLGDHLPPAGTRGQKEMTAGLGGGAGPGRGRGAGWDQPRWHRPLVGGNQADVVGADAQERGSFLDGVVALRGEKVGGRCGAGRGTRPIPKPVPSPSPSPSPSHPAPHLPGGEEGQARQRPVAFLPALREAVEPSHVHGVHVGDGASCQGTGTPTSQPGTSHRRWGRG